MISKVEGTGGVRGTAPVRKSGKAGKAGSADFAQHLQDDSVSGAGNLSGVAGVSAVGALIGIQEVESATDREARGKKRANLLLSEMDELRLALLTGTISKEQLLRLSAMVQSHKEQIDDPRLAGVLDEIDLRARVELAKYGF